MLQSMFGKLTGQFGRCVLVVLAGVAASYHLTETAHLQAERARRLAILAEKQDEPAGKDQDGESDEPQPIIWNAPDMLDRVGPRVADSQVTIRERGGRGPDVTISDPPALRPDSSRSMPDSVCLWGDRRSSVFGVSLTDRPIHGPPGLC